MADFSFLKGNIETIILNALYSGEKYGYEIAREIKEKTSNKYEIKQPTLYAYLKRLEDRDMIVSFWGNDSRGGRRRYYKLTDSGKQVCIDYMSEWTFQRDVIDSLVSDTDGEIPLNDVTQQQATPLFGSKTKRSYKRSEASPTDLAEINRQLNQLTAQQSAQNINEQLKNTPPAKPQQIFAPIKQPTEAKQESTPTQTPKQDIVLTEKPSATPPVTPIATPVPQETLQTQSSKQAYESLYSNANKGTQGPVNTESKEEKQYKQILENIIGDQFNKIKSVQKDTTEKINAALSQQATIPTANTPLNQTAKKLKEEGVQIKIYTPNDEYKPVPMLFTNKLQCLSAWLIAVLLSLQLTLMYFIFKNITQELKFTMFAVLITLFILIAIAFTVKYRLNPSLKTKTHFNFKFNFVNGWIFVGVAAIIFAIIYFIIIGTGDVKQLLIYFILPVELSINAPIGVWIYGLINKALCK